MAMFFSSSSFKEASSLDTRVALKKKRKNKPTHKKLYPSDYYDFNMVWLCLPKAHCWNFVLNMAVLGGGRTFQEVGPNIGELVHLVSASGRNDKVLSGLQLVSCFD